MAQETILIIDDEPEAVDLIRFNLKATGRKVVSARTGASGLQKAAARLPNLIVLDLNLPDQDGLDICKLLQRNGRTAQIPIIIVSARTTELDRLVGLEFAQDYLAKPFSPRELILRIDHLLAKPIVNPPSDPDYKRFGCLTIHKGRHEVTVDGNEVMLARGEFQLLSILAEHRHRVQTREELVRQIGGESANVDQRAVDNLMRRLRGKLGRAAKHLRTVRGLGYGFIESP